MCLNIDGNIISNPYEVSNKLNTFYTTVAQKLVNKLPSSKISFKQYLRNPIQKTFFMSPTNPSEVEILINNLNVSKSSDIYDIPVKIIKVAGPYISTIFSDIFNKSFSNGVFPQKLKYAFVLPLFKGGSKLVLSNYRPISILPILSKVLEQLMQARLVNFLTTNNIIYEHQFGFQQNKSATIAVLDVQTKIIEAFENKKIACGVFLDFPKAFDTVSHEILLGKLEHYGIRGLSNSWFRSYLTDRCQKVKIGSVLSDKNLITCGVPHGNVLGPILFLLYINDIKESSETLYFFLFADDTSTLFCHEDIRCIEKIYNEELQKVSEWLIGNKLSLNVSKSNMVMFRAHTKKIRCKLSIKINNETINKKCHTKYLWMILDNNLTWTQHINYVNLKLSKSIGILCKLRHLVTKQMLRPLYFTFVQPYIDYGLIDWGGANRSTLELVRKSIRKAVRILSFQKKECHKDQLFENLKILNFDLYNEFTIGKFMWKLSNNLLPNCINKLFKSNEVHKHIPGHENDFFLPAINTEIKRRTVTFKGIKIWKKIPSDIKSIPLFSKFKKQLHNSLLNIS